jgi:phosphoketolase
MQRLMVVLLLAAAAGPLHADIWKCVGANGDVLFTSDRVEAKQKGCAQITVTPNVVSLPPPGGATVPRSGGASPTPGSFPKIAPQVQQQRDTDRRRILETELITEEKNLQQAKRELAEQENTRLGSERNAQRMLDRIEPYQKKVKLHEDNVANLKKELSNIR